MTPRRAARQEPASFRFSAPVERVGRNPCVAVPARVSAALGRHGPVRVKGTLNGTPIRATLMPAGGGRHQLYVNAAMRRDAGVDVGDRARLVLRESAEPERPSLPPDLARALAAAPRASAALDALPAARQGELVAWVLAARRRDTRRERVRCLLDLLAGRKRR